MNPDTLQQDGLTYGCPEFISPSSRGKGYIPFKTCKDMCRCKGYILSTGSLFGDMV